ncbi:hypothetical protein Tco_0803870 [Tanacetum coccineum]|uniref:Zinc finger, CCHC-type n=1 Tax=Tanacetum coccineum TaxID=301880 RepID=A0ABQ5A3R6_9ASTR
MVVAATKHMASNFAKLDKFERVDFRRWQKKIHFLLSSMNVVYVLTTLIPEDSENAIDSLEAKYMAEDAISKKFLVSNFTNYKMTDSRPVMEQYNKLLSILGRFTQHKINMDEAIQDSDKPKGNNVAGPIVVNMVEYKNSFMYNDNKGKRKHQGTKVDPNKKSKGLHEDEVAWCDEHLEAFGGNTRDLGSFGEETNKITNQHQDSSRFKVSEPGDGVTIYTRWRHTSSSDYVTTSLDAGSPHRLNSDLEDSTL